MSRTRREVIINIPHHVTQRGGRRQRVFFSDADCQFYLSCLLEYMSIYHVEIYAYCLMVNHVHLIIVPLAADSLHRFFKAVHSKYARYINAQYSWTGHLWQARFFSSPLDVEHFLTAITYVEENPVRAGMVERPEMYRWSSAAHRLNGAANPLITSTGVWANLVDLMPKDNLFRVESSRIIENLRLATQRCLPCGSKEFVDGLSLEVGRDLSIKPHGRPRKVVP